MKKNTFYYIKVFQYNNNFIIYKRWNPLDLVIQQENVSR